MALSDRQSNGAEDFPPLQSRFACKRATGALRWQALTAELEILREETKDRMFGATTATTMS